MIIAERYHDISCGHRVHGHESKCAHLHGHNYRITFYIQTEDGEVDDVGRVLDFSVIKSKLCMWLENMWDHKFLCWDDDPIMRGILSTAKLEPDDAFLFLSSLVWVPFNPTAENMAKYLVEAVGPMELNGTGCILTACKVEETRKCSASYILDC